MLVLIAACANLPHRRRGDRPEAGPSSRARTRTSGSARGSPDPRSPRPPRPPPGARTAWRRPPWRRRADARSRPSGRPGPAAAAPRRTAPAAGPSCLPPAAWHGLRLQMRVLRDFLDGGRVVVAAIDRLFEDGRVRGNSPEPVLRHQTLELAARDQAAPDEVEPHRLPVLAQRRHGILDGRGRARGAHPVISL